MNLDPQSQDEPSDKPVHWTVQLPWLLVLLAVALVAPLQMDMENFSKPKVADETVPEQESAKIDINSASQKELESLPHIGPVLAQRIIAARPFGTVEELARVQGIGTSLIKRLAPWVTLAH